MWNSTQVLAGHYLNKFVNQLNNSNQKKPYRIAVQYPAVTDSLYYPFQSCGRYGSAELVPYFGCHLAILKQFSRSFVFGQTGLEIRRTTYASHFGGIGYSSNSTRCIRRRANSCTTRNVQRQFYQDCVLPWSSSHKQPGHSQVGRSASSLVKQYRYNALIIWEQISGWTRKYLSCAMEEHSDRWAAFKRKQLSGLGSILCSIIKCDQGLQSHT